MPALAPLIMLVDDDTDFLQMHKGVLESGGYRVVCVSNSQEALDKIALEKPHLVVTDLMMKSLDAGFSLARQIKEDARFAHIPVVIVTAVGSQRGFDFRPRSPEDLAAMHADAYFEKPVAPQALLAKIHELLRRDKQEGTQ